MVEESILLVVVVDSVFVCVFEVGKLFVVSVDSVASRVVIGAKCIVATADSVFTCEAEDGISVAVAETSAGA